MKTRYSGYDWFGDIPETWEMLPIRAIYDERRDKNVNNKVTQVLSLLKDIGIIPYEEKGDIGNKMTDTPENHKIVEPGDLVVNKMNAVIGSLGISQYKGTVSQVYFVLRLKNTNCNNEYLEYIFKYRGFQRSLRMISKGIMEIRESIDWTDFKNLRVPIPPLNEQDEIVQYIKAQEEKINLFIQKKQRFIELLKEQKDLIAFSAIHMDGLKNGCPERRIKSFSQILRGKFTHRPRNDERLYDGEYPFIQTGEVSQANKYINGYRQTLNDWGYSVSKEFPKGTLCLTIAANVGDVAILNFNACFPDSIVGIVPNDEVNIDFLYHALKSLKAKFLSEATLTTQYNLNVERIGPIKIPIPNLETQKKIVTELETETATIDTAIAKAEREIELIREYKEAMIAEAVMGKRK
jgi:type I restriction enzyme S subunit